MNFKYVWGWGCSFREVGVEEEKVVGQDGVGDCDDEADGAVDGWIVRMGVSLRGRFASSPPAAPTRYSHQICGTAG